MAECSFEHLVISNLILHKTTKPGFHFGGIGLSPSKTAGKTFRKPPVRSAGRPPGSASNFGHSPDLLALPLTFQGIYILSGL